MRILTVFPGPLSSTFDVASGYKNAIGDNNFVEQRVFNYHNMIHYHRASIELFNPDLDEENVAIITTSRASRELLADIATFMPDVVFVVSGSLIPFDTWNYVSALRQNFIEKFVIALYLTECPYLDNMQYNFSKYADILYINDKQSLSRFDKDGTKHVYYLPHFTKTQKFLRNSDVRNTNYFNEMNNVSYKSDVLFCGTPFYERLEMLSQVEWKNVDLKLIFYWNDEIDTKFNELKKYLYIDDVIENTELAEYYRNAKISINIHRTRPELTGDVPALNNYTDAYSIGPRLYEIAACGSLIMTDYREEAVDLFGDSIVIFNDGYELKHKIEYYLHSDNENERLEMVAAAEEKVQNCTFSNRLNDIVLPTLNSVLEQYSDYKGVK
jgi:spore maturation protein CgeB